MPDDTNAGWPISPGWLPTRKLGSLRILDIIRRLGRLVASVGTGSTHFLRSAFVEYKCPFSCSPWPYKPALSINLPSFLAGALVASPFVKSPRIADYAVMALSVLLAFPIW